MRARPRRASRRARCDGLGQSLDNSPMITIVGVIGAGLMGRGIAQIAAQAGCEVRVVDARPGAAAQAKQEIDKTLASLAAKGKLNEAEAKSAVARVVLP